jgi:2-oxo-4-hydroxy-4-carboxy-5-ureidoimidazoline decarboxylase
MPALTLARVNAMTPEAFREALGGVFEHSPWIAQRTFAARPFASVAALHAAMTDVVRRASREEQLALLRSHPELAGKEARSGTMTRDSTAEQGAAGLGALSAEEMRRIGGLNRSYREKFGFPFIIAVRRHTKDSIFAELERRLGNDVDTELANGLQQVFLIARLRLDGLIGTEGPDL